MQPPRKVYGSIISIMNIFKWLWNLIFSPKQEEENFFLFESDRDFDEDAEILVDFLPPTGE